MTALVFTAVAVLLVAGPLAVALTHQPRQENTMSEGLTGRHVADFEDIGDRGTCTTRGRHEHRWWQIVNRDGEQVKLGIVLEVSPSGLVMLSEGSVEEILTAAGFTRSEP